MFFTILMLTHILPLTYPKGDAVDGNLILAVVSNILMYNWCLMSDQYRFITVEYTNVRKMVKRN